MKLVTFQTPGSEPRVGALVDEGRSVVDLRAASQAGEGDSPLYFVSMLAFLEAGAAAREHAATLTGGAAQAFVHSLEQVKLLAPVPRPLSIRDCMSFEKHVVQATRTVVKWKFAPLARLDAWVEDKLGKPLVGAPKVWYERPLYYKGNPASVVGPDTDVRWPKYSGKIDFELEIGIFIGRWGRDIAVEDAGNYIAGYTIFNDFSARDIQLREMQGRLGPAKGKDFDTGNAMGPCLVTPDDIPDPYRLTMTARVNGEQWTRATTADMHFTFEQMIAYISQSETLYPGDFIGAGTAPGGCGLELDRWLANGDVVELEIENIGVLRNRVVRQYGSPI